MKKTNSRKLEELKISVLTSSLNTGAHIERAIQSVLNQDYNNWEHIVVDGESTDNSLDILKRYSHIKWISEKDCGQSDAMNKAFKMSEGEIIVYLNADDEFASGAFRAVIEAFSRSSIDMVIGNLIQSYPNNEQRCDVPHTQLLRILHYWPCAFPLNPVSYFYSRKLQVKIGDFPITNHYTMDYWFLLHAFKQAKIAKVDKVLGTFYYIDNKSSDAQNARSSLRSVRNQFLLKNPRIAIKYLIYLLFNKSYFS